MSLFDDPDPRPPRVDADWELHRRHRQPHAGPAQDEVGVLAMSSFHLARSSDVAVSVRGVTAFSDGLLLSVVGPLLGAAATSRPVWEDGRT